MRVLYDVRKSLQIITGSQFWQLQFACLAVVFIAGFDRNHFL